MGGGVEKPLGFLCAILALFFISFNAHAATLNFQHNGTTKQIELDTEKRTAPSLAMRVGDTVYYANLVETGTCASGNACVSYGNKTYKIHDNIEYKFTITTTSMDANTTFSFQMSAAGKFTVDWGDGNVEEIVRSDTESETYSHTYNTAGVRVIGFNGTATGYSTDNYTAAIKFYEPINNSHQKISAISGSLGTIFPTLGTTNGKQPRFSQTFQNCVNLTRLPEGLFANISGAAHYMFYGTFSGCSGLKSLPSGLFNGISGSAEAMFSNTFGDCTGLTGLPSGLFNGISGAAGYMFGYTFSGCTGLTGLPSGLFNGISGAAKYLFYNTFRGCVGLKNLPSGLFGGISGAEEAMFSSTFYNCTSLTELPPGLFAKVSGAADYMFAYTFSGCAGLTSLPSGLFSGMSGSASYMFNGTFRSCSGLTGTIPYGFFGNPSGAPEPYMFQYTFYGCTNLTGPTARLSNGTRLYDIMYKDQTWLDLNSDAFYNMYTNTQVKDPVFEVITTPDTTSFSFSMSAAGKFTVDWGDGNVEEIVRSDTESETYSHTYNTAGVRVIGFNGTATGYSTNSTTAAIRFSSNKNIFKISGSLGAIFPTIDDGTAPDSQPRFYYTFASCYNLKELPGDLFANISGSATNMFAYTFQNCSNLTELPSGLFANISGAAERMFYSTFYGCSGLTELPPGLFANISGSATNMFAYTFQNCSNLTELPPGLFANISDAAPYMFYSTFQDCSNLKKLPGDLFAKVSGAASYMFAYTFQNCSNLTELPPGLFANISGSAYGMFRYTFNGCSSLTGESAKIGDKYLYQIYNSYVGEQCYSGDTGLSDYDSIPSGWK